MMGRPQRVIEVLSWLFVVAFVVACHPRPTEELVLADVAIRAAQKVKADALAPDLFRKAENHLLRAKKDYAEGYYESCKKNATEARLSAEQAEYKAFQKQTQLKDKNPDEDFAAPTEPAGGP
jgi:hypothetical protein